MSSPSVQSRHLFLSGLFPSDLSRSTSLTFFTASSFLDDSGGGGGGIGLMEDSPRWSVERSPIPFSSADTLSPPPSPGYYAPFSSALPPPPVLSPAADSPDLLSTASTPSSASVDSADSASATATPSLAASSPPPPLSPSPLPSFRFSSSTAKRLRRDSSPPPRLSSGDEEPPKRSHREIDADRRAKEAAVIRRLEGLTELVLPTRTKRGKVRKSTAARKLAVLEASAEKIEQLQAVIQEMATAVSLRQERQVRVLSSLSTGLDAYAAYMRTVPSTFGQSASSNRRLLKFLDGCAALTLPIFTHADVCMLVFNIERIQGGEGKLLCANPSAAPHTASQHSTTQLHTRPSLGRAERTWLTWCVCACVCAAAPSVGSQAGSRLSSVARTALTRPAAATPGPTR